MGKSKRQQIKEAIKQLEELDELVIDMAVPGESGHTQMLIFNTGDILSKQEETSAR